MVFDLISHQSDYITFSVIVILLSISVLTWTVILTKLFYFWRIRVNNNKFIKVFWESNSLSNLRNKLDKYPYSPIKEAFKAGYEELRLIKRLKDNKTFLNSAINNVERSLFKTKILENKRLEKFLTILVISASIAPFIGLLGTVWGIMNSFKEIANTGNAHLTVVAPGISEALVATAIGLIAAIPAAIAYNIFIAKIKYLSTNIESFNLDFLNIVERYLIQNKINSNNEDIEN